MNTSVGTPLTKTLAVIFGFSQLVSCLGSAAMEFNTLVWLSGVNLLQFLTSFGQLCNGSYIITLTNECRHGLLGCWSLWSLMSLSWPMCFIMTTSLGVWGVLDHVAIKFMVETFQAGSSPSTCW